jgi:putative hemolysin
MTINNKKWILYFIIFLIAHIQIVSAEIAFDNPVLNPAAVYCSNLGYQSKILTNPEGEYGTCQLPDGQVIDEWRFFLGDAGQDFNYCGLKGYKTEISTDPTITYYYLTDHVAVCKLPDGSSVEVGDLMKMNYDSLGFSDDFKNRPVFQPLNDLIVTEGTPIKIKMQVTDPTNDPMTFSCAMLPTGATLASDEFSWTPQTGQAGKYMLAFVVSDGKLEAFQTMTITVIPASLEVGGLSVDSTPQGAKISLDGVKTKYVTPYTFTNLPIGNHKVNVTLSKYVTPNDETIAVVTGQTATVFFTLQKTSAVPEFPSTFLPAILVFGFLGSVFLIQRTREH